MADLSDYRLSELLRWTSNNNMPDMHGMLLELQMHRRAAPVLRAVVEAALAYEKARTDGARARSAYAASGLDSLLSGVDVHDRNEALCRTAYLAALAMVTP